MRGEGPGLCPCHCQPCAPHCPCSRPPLVAQQISGPLLTAKQRRRLTGNINRETVWRSPGASQPWIRSSQSLEARPVLVPMLLGQQTWLRQVGETAPLHLSEGLQMRLRTCACSALASGNSTPHILTPACTCCAAGEALQDERWTFLTSGALPFACDAVAAAPDAHQKLHAVALLTTCLQRIKECLEVRSLPMSAVHSSYSGPCRARDACLSVCLQRAWAKLHFRRIGCRCSPVGGGD